MRQETHTCTTHASREVVWDFLSDYEHCIRLSAPSARVQLVSGAPGKPGARYAATIDWEGVPSKFQVTLMEAKRPETIVWVAHAAGASGGSRFELAPCEAGTTVSVTTRLAMGKAMLPLEPFGWALLSRFQDRFLRRLRAAELPEYGAVPQEWSRSTQSHPSA